MVGFTGLLTRTVKMTPRLPVSYINLLVTSDYLKLKTLRNTIQNRNRTNVYLYIRLEGINYILLTRHLRVWRHMAPDIERLGRYS